MGVVLSEAGGAKWPIATYRCPSLEPSPSVAGSAHRPLAPLCPPSPCLTYPDGGSPAAQMGCLGNRSGSPSGADQP